MKFSGYIKKQDGSPLQGANIQNLTTKTSVVSNNEGYYEIYVEGNHALVFTHPNSTQTYKITVGKMLEHSLSFIINKEEFKPSHTTVRIKCNWLCWVIPVLGLTYLLSKNKKTKTVKV